MNDESVVFYSLRSGFESRSLKTIRPSLIASLNLEGNLYGKGMNYSPAVKLMRETREYTTDRDLQGIRP